MKKFLVFILISTLVFISLGCGSQVDQSQYDSLEQEVNSLKSERDSISSERDSLKTENDNLLSQVNDLTDSLSETQSELEEAQSEISSLNDKISKMEEETLIPQYKEEAEPVINAINEIGEVTLDSGEKIASAQELYTGLSEGAKSQVSNYSTLEDATQTLIDLQKQREDEIGYDTGITFDQLSRDPDDYMGDKVKFSGNVLQVSESGDSVVVRLATKGKYDNVIMVGIDSDLLDHRLLEDDKITIYGISLGITSYTTVMGAKVTLPLISADRVEF